MNIRNSEKGIAALGTALALVVLGFVLVSTLQDQTVFFVHQSFRNRTRLDVENSIDAFAHELYYSYVMAGGEGDSSQPGVPYASAADILTSNAAAGTPTKKLYWPNAKKICFARELTSWSQAPTAAPLSNQDPICLDRTRGFTFYLNAEAVEMVVENFHTQAPALSPRDRAIGFLKSATEFFHLREAEAQDMIADPGAGVFSSISFPTTPNWATTRFTKTYANYNCNAPTGAESFECVTVKFCARLKQQCNAANPNEWVTQTYLFDKVPKTQLRD